ncbi:MAG: hypothetical protein IPM26_01790 [Saprospiraceae bacterium]|nr:hypothetical protein [Saprospiraceae bacterium]
MLAAPGDDPCCHFSDEMGNELDVLTNDYGTVPAGSIIENKPFSKTYTPPAIEGVYYGDYFIFSPEESPSANNTLEFFFQVTDKTFGNLLPKIR